MSLSTTQVESFYQLPTETFQLALVHHSLANLATNRQVISNYPHQFNHEVEHVGKITNQRSSGRCWLFAALNMIRCSFMEKYKLDNFEFSQAYMFFWDKLERINWFLESYMELRKTRKMSDRYVHHMLHDPLSDGGQWTMVASLIRKYGLVPKSSMEDSYHAASSREMNTVLIRKMREYCLQLDRVSEMEAKKELKESFMKEVWQLLVGFLGKPPQRINYQTKDKDKKWVKFENMTPQEFFAKTEFNLDDWVPIVHDPREENDYYRKYGVEYLGNMVGETVTYLNLPMERFKQLSKQMLDNGRAIWFGCDVGQERHRKSGVHDIDILNIEKFLGTKFRMTKEERLNTGESLMTHAMVLVGYHEKEGKPYSWKVENSWGKDSGHNGYLLLTDRWFDEYVYEVLVPKSYLSNDEVNQWNGDIEKMLPPWDPMGSLAKL